MNVQLVAAPDPVSNAADSAISAPTAYPASSWPRHLGRTLKSSGGLFGFSCCRTFRLIVLVDHNLQPYQDCLAMLQVVVITFHYLSWITWLLERGLGRSDQTAEYARTSSQTR